MSIPLRSGRQIRLRSDFAGSFLSVDGFVDGYARKSRFRAISGEVGGGNDEVHHYPTDQIFQIVAVGEHPSQILFTGSWSPAVAAMRGKGRVDLELQKIAVAPRLLASKLETANLKEMSREELKDLMSKILIADARISGLVVGFEPGRKDAETEHFCLYAGRDRSVEDDEDIRIKFADLTPDSGYLPMYREWQWFRFPKANDVSYWAEPYLDEGAGNVPTISYSVPIKQQGQFVGVVKMDIELDLESSAALSAKPLSAEGTDDKTESVDNDKVLKQRMQEILESITAGPAAAAEKLSISPVLDDEVLKSTLSELLSGQTRNILSACIAFDRGQSGRPELGPRDKYAIQAKKEKVTGDISFSVLAQTDNYLDAPWFKDYFSKGESGWGAVMDDPLRKGERVTSYSLPFHSRASKKDVGVIRLDVQYDSQLKAEVEAGDKNKTVYCTACDLEVPLCYFQNNVTLNKICICLRDFVDGIISWGTSATDYVKVEKRAYKEYLEQYRRPSDIVFGQVVQLVHCKVGRFLSVTIKENTSAPSNGGPREFYQVELENDLLLSDPYLEGTENSWFTIMPSSDRRSLGERVMEEDQVKLVSTRWQWEMRFPETEADRIMDVKADDLQRQTTEGVFKAVSSGFTLGSPMSWKLLSCGETDEQVAAEIKLKHLKKKAADALQLAEEAAERAKKKKEGDEDNKKPSEEGTIPGPAGSAPVSVSERNNIDFGLLQPPSTLSPYVRNGDLIYIRQGNTNDCLSVSANFHPKSEDAKLGAAALNDAESAYVYYGRYSYEVNLQEENRGTAVWQLEVPTPDDTHTRLLQSTGSFDDTCTVVRWGQAVRLRHGASMRFLCLSKKGIVIDEKKQQGNVSRFLCSTCAADRVVDDNFKTTAAKEHDDTVTDEHVMVRFVPIDVTQEYDDVVTVNTPFYLKMIPNARVNKFMADEYWLNLAGKGPYWTSFRDDQDTFSIKKGTLTEQKAIYQSRGYFQQLDQGIDILYREYDKFPKPTPKAAGPGQSNRPSEWVNDFVRSKIISDNFTQILPFIKFCQNFVIMAGNSATADPPGMLLDARNYESEANTGFCLRFRQELAVRANIFGRIFSIIMHPLFGELVKFPPSLSSGDDEEDEKTELASALDAKRKQTSAADEKKAEEEDAKKQARELVLDAFRECSRLGALLCVDYADAAIEVTKLEGSMDFLIKMLHPSSYHSLGVNVWLSLIMENGRDKKASLSLTPANLQECMRTWESIMRRRSKLQRQREKATSRRYSPSVWRSIAAQDAFLSETQTTFIRFLCGLCHSVGIPDAGGQKRVLDAFVAQAKKYRLGADGQPLFDDSSHDTGSTASGFSTSTGMSSIASTSATTQSKSETESKIPKPIETQPNVLRLMAAMVLGAARTGIQARQVSKELAAVLGIPELDLSFSGLMARVRDNKLSYGVRSRYCEIVHHIYFERMYPRRLINYLPFVGAGGHQLVSTDGLQISSNEDRGGTNYQVGQEEVIDCWNFILDFLSSCGSHHEMNRFSLAVLGLTRCLMELDFEDIDEDSDATEGLFGIGTGTKLSELATHLYNILKTKQHNPGGMSAVQWNVEQLKFRDIKLEICRIFNILMDIRLNQHMKTFFNLRGTGLEGLIAEASDHEVKAPERQATLTNSDAHVPASQPSTGATLVNPAAPKSDEDKFKLSLPTLGLFGGQKHNKVEEAIFSDKNKLFPGNSLKLDPVLFSVIESWEDSSLVMACFGVLLRDYSQRISLIQAIKKCLYIQNPGHLARAQQMLFDKVDLLNLLRLEMTARDWQDIDLNVFVAKSPDVLRLLRHLESQFKETATEENKEMKVETTQPGSNTLFTQNMMRLIHIHQMLIDILHIPFPPNNEQLREVFDVTYSVLALWASGNKKNVRHLEKHVPFFFSQCYLGAGPTVLLSKIIEDNYEVASRIPQQSLEDYLSYLAQPVVPNEESLREKTGRRGLDSRWWDLTSKFDHSWKRTALPIMFLKLCVRAEDRMVRNNQTLVVKAICENVSILGLLAELEDESKFNQFLAIMNFVPPPQVASSVLNTPRSSEAKSNKPEVVNKLIAEAQAQALRKEYYSELVLALVRCAPCRYVHEKDRAKRESEESSLLVRTALPMKKLINIIILCTNSAARIPLVRLLEQVYNTEISSLPPRLKLKLLRSFADSVDVVAASLDQMVGREHKSVVNRSAAPSPSAANPNDFAYVFEVVLPFLVSFYHSSFRHTTASPDEIAISDDIFDNVVTLTRAALIYRARDDPAARQAKSVQHSPGQQQGLRRVHRQSVSIALGSDILVGATSLDNAVNCLMHMADPTGSGIFKESDEGVMGTQNREEFIQLFKKCQTVIMTEQDRKKAEEEEKKHAPKQETGVSLERWALKNKRLFVEGARKEMNEFFAIMATQNTNERLMRKIILMCGEFATDEDAAMLKGGRRMTGVEWIDDNSRRFAQSYIQALQHLIDIDEDDSTKDTLISLGLCRILIQLISRSSSLRVKKAVFQLGNAVFSAGLRTQEAFRQEYLNQSSNEFFLRLRDLLSTPLKIRSKQEVVSYGTGQTPERFGSWALMSGILRFLQCACEGHNINWQTLLNHQSFAASGTEEESGTHTVGISVNVVTELSEFLARLLYQHGPLWYVVVYWDRWYEFDVINQVLNTTLRLFNTIIEVQQGPCAVNQVEFSYGHFIESLNWLLDAIVTAENSKTFVTDRGNQYGTWTTKDENNEEDDTPDRQDTILELQGLIVTALNSMLEGDCDAAVPRRLIAIFNFSLIENLMGRYLVRFDAESNPDEPDLENPYAVICIDYYIFTRNLISRWESSGCSGPYAPSFASFLKSATYAQCYTRFNPLIASCEFLRDGRLEEVLFRLPGIVQSQSQTVTFKETCNTLIYTVDRENQPTKLSSFLEMTNSLIYELTSFPEWKSSWLVRRSQFFTNATWYLAIILNIMAMIPAFNNDGSDSTRAGQFTRPEALMMYLFGILQTIFAFFRIIAFTASHIPTAMFEYTKGDPDWFYKTGPDGEIDLSPQGRTRTVYRFIPFGIYFALLPFTMYQLLYVAFSIIAQDTHAFYAYHLLDLIGRSDQLREVFSSLSKYGSTLGLTALLWIVLTYAFVMWGYLGFPEDFRQAANTSNMGVPGDNYSGNCDSPWECFFYHLTWSIRQGGGIGDSLIPVGQFWHDPEFANFTHFYFRVIYDLGFFIVCCVIMIAIVTGIIIDAFGASRDRRKEVEEDQAAKCFICGIEGSRFETKRPKDKNDTRHYGFAWHLDHEHNIWNYVYFLAHLSLKDPNEYTGSESYVAKLVKESLTDFFPTDRSLMLEA